MPATSRCCPDVQIFHAYDYQEAEKLLKTDTAFDLIVSDFHFPGRVPETMNGGADFYELAVTVAPSIPFFFLSSSEPIDIHFALRCRELAIDAHNVFGKETYISDIILKAIPETPVFVPEGNVKELKC